MHSLSENPVELCMCTFTSVLVIIRGDGRHANIIFAPVQISSAFQMHTNELHALVRVRAKGFMRMVNLFGRIGTLPIHAKVHRESNA